MTLVSRFGFEFESGPAGSISTAKTVSDVWFECPHLAASLAITSSIVDKKSPP